MSKNLFATKEFDNSHEGKSTNSIKKALVEALVFILTLAIIAPIAMYTVQYAFGSDASPFLVSGTSMYPTLDDRQMVIVNKTEDRIENGSIIVSLLPESGYAFTSNKEEGQHIVKRVIAGPGETVDIGYDDIIKVNGVAVDEPYLTEAAKNETYVPNYQNHYVLADDEYFVVGDNRGNSCDSRYFGVVNEEYITGVVNNNTVNSMFMIASVVTYAVGIIVLYLLVEKLLTVILNKVFKV